MTRDLWVVACAGVCAGLLAGCGGGEPVSVGTAGEAGSGTAAAATPTASWAVTPTGSMESAPDPDSTAPISGGATPSPSGVLRAAVVDEIRVADHATFDRVVDEYRGTFGAWQVRYVDAVTEDPTGQPVELAGRAFLAVAVDGATFDNALQADDTVPHLSYAGPHRIQVAGANVREVADAGDFEAVMSLGIGLDHPAGVRAYRLEDPSRLVIDVGH